MMGVLGWDPRVTMEGSLRTLVVAYEAKVVNDWNHTAQLSSHIYNLSVLVSSFGGKSKMKPEPPIAFHPLLKHKQKKGYKITKKNFGDLRSIFSAAMSGGLCRVPG